jgi:hypothetical protein
MLVDSSPARQTNFPYMIRSFLVLSLIVVALTAQAQETKNEKVKTVARPNIPGSFIVDFGFNQAIHKPENFKQDFWGSRTCNLYYQYGLRIGRSHFSVNPAIGMSLERFKFDNNYMLFDAEEPTGAPRFEHYALVPAAPYFTPEIKKVMLIANYIEMPLEIRFDTKPEDIARSFNFALGGRIGVLFDSDQKVKYREDDQWKKSKNKEDWGLNLLRYGVYTRIGIGGFNFFGFYNLSPLFQKNVGPDNTTMNTYTFGISVNGF